MWLYGSGNDGLPPIRLYDYQSSRDRYHAEEFLKGFSGYLTSDGFSGYNKLKDVIRCGCLTHMRRYWHDALPGKSKKSPETTPAESGFDYCSQLFELEKEYADLDADTRKARRLETEPVIWEAYWSWLETVNPVGGSCLAKAVTYAKNQKPYMENYLLDGRCSISNNIAENIARPSLCGRAEKFSVPRYRKRRPGQCHHLQFSGNRKTQQSEYLCISGDRTALYAGLQK